MYNQKLTEWWESTLRLGDLKPGPDQASKGKEGLALLRGYHTAHGQVGREMLQMLV
jgi:hypothetical protein